MGTIPGIWGYCPYLWKSGHMTHLRLYRVHVQNVNSWIGVLHNLCHSTTLETVEAIKNLNSKTYFLQKIRSRSYSMSVTNFNGLGFSFAIFSHRWENIGSSIWNVTYMLKVNLIKNFREGTWHWRTCYQEYTLL